ncbi:TnsD family Tn7-like transposition protein [Paraglaciecola hydrolytica]|uniref:Uncharacterized protein n=1 Tax=Paraglaciecola hydrolytica TaxID=1799789 RepID=A0A148KL95_9ALTE|nr:TnsD family Tn7-like transposition protein [Paraglaciecola hydrolytica]KXI27039.1 hypothetical protein AX660_02095 [Paraglaciecola hydrolytica]
MSYSVILPEETVASFVIRQVLESGYPTGRIAQKYLWGNENLQINSLFPSLMPWISKNYNLDIERLVHQHTCLDYYRSFLSPDKFLQIKKKLILGNTKLLHKWLGITSNRLVYSDSFRYCPTCVVKDITNHGVAYWHRQHQLYGVFQCHQHGTFLESTKITRRSLVLPPQTLTLKQYSVEPKVLPFTSFSQWAMEQNKVQYFNFKQLTTSYKLVMLDKGLACPSFGIRQYKLRNAIIRHYQQWSSSHEWRRLLYSNQTHPFPQQLFYNYQSCHLHPAKHLALISFLFLTPEQFLDSYFAATEQLSLKVKNVVSKKGAESRIRPECINEIMNLHSQERSLRNISKVVGVSVSSVKSIILSKGGKVNRRPSKIFSDERKVILGELTKGESSKNIASKLGISIGAVEQILTQNPTLVFERKKLRFEQKQNKHRKILISKTSNYPDLSRDQLKMAISVTYMWLYKNDKEWLYKALPKSLL